MPVLAAAALLQTVLAFDVDGEGPVRLGFPLRVGDLAAGLAVSSGVLQWAPLVEHPDPVTGRVWVELWVAGARGTVRVRRGGDGPAAAAGPVVRRDDTSSDDVLGRRRTATCTFRDGTVEQRSVVELRGPLPLAADDQGPAETLGAGERLIEGNEAFAARRLRVRIGERWWRAAGVLPGDGRLARPWREALLAAVARLRSPPGVRGRGDYLRSGGVVTNLEFDLALGFARLALATGSRDALGRAFESAWHLVAHDLDPLSGLPFRHGRGHRSARPELGHCWVRGLWTAGCLFADRELLEAARSVARALAEAVERRERPSEYARDVGWPLGELEALYRATGEEPLRAAADRLARELVARWDPELAVFRFGEGESRGEAYEERCWITGGVLLPALRAHARRTGDARAAAMAAEAAERIAAAVGRGAPGIPLRYWVRGRARFGELRVEGAAEGFATLEGLGPRRLRDALGRRQVRRALDACFDPGDEDLPTQVAIAARCEWVVR